MILTDAHVSASISGPSRCGLLTGRYQQRNGYERNLGNKFGMGLEEETMGDIFSWNGYHTACIGNGIRAMPPNHPNCRGFEHFYGFISGGRSYFYRQNNEGRPGDVHNLQVKIAFNGYLTDVLADEVVSYIEKRAYSNAPFRINLVFNAVHAPLEATDEDMARFDGHPRRKLAAMTWAVDRGIWKAVQALKKTENLTIRLYSF